MDRIVVPAAASVVIGLLLGASAVLALTLQIGTHPPQPHGDSTAAMLNTVEYGDRQ